MTREEREKFIHEYHGERTKGFLDKDKRREFLDKLAILDTEGLGLLTKNLLAALKRSKHFEGFGLELSTALLCSQLPQPRQIQCEQKEGLAKTPGDIWLNFDNKRYEFQCKYSQNWTVELSIADAIDIVYAETRDITPGLLYELTPEAKGSPDQWRGFAYEIIKHATGYKVGSEFTYQCDGSNLAHVKFTHERKYSGLALGGGWSPGGVQVLDVGLLRKKIVASSANGKPTISAYPSENQINILMIDVESFLVDLEDFFYALYGDIVCTLHHAESGEQFFTQGQSGNGVFRSENMTTWSGVGVLRHRSGTNQSCYVFPNPKHFDDVQAAFKGLANFHFVESSQDV